MMMVRLLVLVQGLLLAARCDGRARKLVLEEDLKDMEDPGDFDDDYGLSDGALRTSSEGTDPNRQSYDLSGTVHYPPDHRETSHGHGLSSQGQSERGTSHIPARTGNWCAFVQKNIVPVAVACGNEKFIIRSHSRCPNGAPDCQIIMYKVSNRTVYREDQRIFTSLLWRCCPGHGGTNCDETVADGHVKSEDSTGRLHPGGQELRQTGSEIRKQNPEQNDNDDPSSALYLSSRENQTEEHNYDYPPSQHDGHEHHYERGDPYGVEDERTGPPPEVPDSNPGLIPIQYLRSIMMAHLQPMFDSFNLTLERLSHEVKELQTDTVQLRLELENMSEVEGGGEGEELQQHEDKLTDTFQQLEELRIQLGLQRDEMGEKLHQQQVMLAYNLTNFKTDVDVKIKRNQKMLQTNLQSLNSSLLEVKEAQELWTPAKMIPTQGQPPQEDTAVWEAITRLDNKVVNNTVRLAALNENQLQTSQNIEHLQKVSKSLDQRTYQTERKSEERYIEATLEVDRAKETFQNHVHEQINNVTTRLQETEVDVDDLYTLFHKSISSSSRDCDCKALSTSVAQLQQDVAQVTVLADQNRLTLDRAAEEKLNSWGDGDWRPSVDDLKLGLQNVQNSLAFEQEKSRTLQQNVTLLHASFLRNQLDVEALLKHNTSTAKDIRRLTSSFSALLKDVLRHDGLLELLLGEEVLEFMDWSPQDQKAHSIPALKENIKDMQEQINGHSRSLASMLNSAPPEDTAADEPSLLADRISVDPKMRNGHQKFEHLSEDYMDTNFYTLEQNVEELQAQLLKLEEQRCQSCCNCTKGAAPGNMEVKLQAELNKMRKSLEDHLRIFSSIFTNTEELAASEATVDLDRLSALMKTKDSRQERKRQKKRADTRTEKPVEHMKHRSKRDASLETAVLSQLPDSPLMFLASRRDGVNESGTVVFETVSLNRGQMYSPKTGTFRAPTAGVYLFVLTLDFGPGPSLAHLKRGEEVAGTLHQSLRKPSGPATRVCLLQLEQGEELQLEIVQGTLEPSNPQDNTFAGLLILQTT